jgi:Transglutaminase-like superfamily
VSSGSGGLRHRRLFPGRVLLVPRILAWTLVMPILKRLVPLSTLVRMLWVERAAAPEPGRQQAIVRTTRRLLRTRSRRGDENCLERSLVLYRFLSLAGLDPRLVLGVRRDAGRLRGHAWVTLAGTPVIEGSVAEFVPIATVGRRGQIEPAGADAGLDVFDVRR